MLSGAVSSMAEQHSTLTLLPAGLGMPRWPSGEALVSWESKDPAPLGGEGGVNSSINQGLAAEKKWLGFRRAASIALSTSSIQ